MKNMTLFAIAGLLLFATAATAQRTGTNNGYMGNQGNMGNRGRMQQEQENYQGQGCAMNNNMGAGMRNRGMRGGGMQGNPSATTPNSNWRANPSYQGQAGSTTTGK